MKLIILTGLARSGKDTVADFLEKDFGFKKLVFSDFLKAEVLKKGLEISKENLALVGDELRKKKGMAVVAELLWNDAKNLEKAVASGSRSVEEVLFLKKKCRNGVVVAVKTDSSKRFERKLENDPQNSKDFFARDQRDIENKGLDKVIALADITIENNSTLEELEKKVKELVGKI